MKRLLFLGLVLLSVSLVRIYVQVLRPLRHLAIQAKRLSDGDFLALAQRQDGVAEIETVRAAMQAMVGHVRRVQAQERAYIGALTNGQEAERTRIARELHDDTTQSLIAIAQSLEMAQESAGVDTPTGQMLQTAREQAIETVANLRRLIVDLRPPALAELGLVPALQMLAEGTSEMQITVEVEGSARRLNERVELALFRCTQEAVRNAQRHGQAKQVDLKLVFQVQTVHLTIQDDGLGFEGPAEIETLTTRGHYGLVGLFERIQHLDGTIQIQSKPGLGVSIAIEVPTSEAVQPAGIVRDPVCSALIEPHQAYASLEYRGTRYCFCCPVCQGAFQTEPEFYLRHQAGK